MDKNSTFEESLKVLYTKAQENPLTLEEILKILSGKGSSLLLIFLSLPFCQPLQIPGLSTPFGLLIAFLGYRMCFGTKTLLPRSLLKKSISSKNIQKTAEHTLKFLEKLKFLTRKRFHWVCHHPKLHFFNGVILCLEGILLALPLPIPLTNIVLGWSIFLTSLGILKDDGLFVLLGYLIFFSSILSIVLIVILFNNSFK